jgi:hypothetical protein
MYRVWRTSREMGLNSHQRSERWGFTRLSCSEFSFF